ncbi:MAG: hypothetical protein N2448_09680 [Caloramator sp.]|nr:hypothetical protein [Caloramator sp.]
MNSNSKKRVTEYIIITVLLLIVSLIYKADFVRKDIERKTLEQSSKKTVVTLFTRESSDSIKLSEDIKKFNIENKDIYIDYQYYGDEYNNLLRMSLQSKDRPDIFQLGFYDIVDKEKVYTLEEIGTDTNGIESKRIFTYKGRPIGIKVSGGTVKIAYNKDIFKKSGLNSENPPKTFGELLDYARKIKQKNPDIIPFEFPASSFGDLKISIGQPSVSKGDIYTSFWDYKNGEYNFNYAKDIIKKYNELYKEGLIPEDFNKKNIKKVREDFINQKAAMIISISDDKKYFEDSNLNFDVGIANLPKFYGQLNSKYYYANINVLVMYKNDNDYDKVKKVYKWLYDEYDKLNNEKKSLKDYKYAEYNNVTYFDFEGNDPTGCFDVNFSKVNDLIYKGIKGEEKINNVTKSLNSYFNELKDTKIKQEPDFLKDYISR